MASRLGHDVAGGVLLIYNKVGQSAKGRDRGSKLPLPHLIQLYPPEYERKGQMAGCFSKQRFAQNP